MLLQEKELMLSVHSFPATLSYPLVLRLCVYMAKSLGFSTYKILFTFQKDSFFILSNLNTTYIIFFHKYLGQISSITLSNWEKAASFIFYDHSECFGVFL